MNRASGTGPDRAVFALIATLVAVLVVWHARRYSAGAALISLGLLVTPWLLVLPGIRRRSRQMMQFAAFLTAPYLVYGLTEVLANPGARIYAGMTVLTAFALFAALVYALRAAATAR
jgi:uncharacterized membrane protein